MGALLLWVTSCQRVEAPADPPVPETGPHAVAAQSSLLPGSTQELHKTLEARYRLGPDRRLLLALADLDTLTGAGPTKAPTARWVEDHFVLEREGTEFARLSEFADFPECYALLTSAAARQVGRLAVSTAPTVPPASPPLPAPARPEPRPARRGARQVLAKAARAAKDAQPPPGPQPLLLQEEAFAVLARIEEAWTAGHHTRGGLDTAALALASLAFQSLDTAELGERLAARALAVVALARASSGPRASPEVTRAEALIAHALGYDVTAARLASALPAGDALRSYLRADEDPMAALQTGAALGDSPAATYLWARRRAEAGAAAPRSWLLDEAIELPAVANRLRPSERSATTADDALTVARLAIARLAADAGRGALATRFRSLVRARGAGPRALEYRRLVATVEATPGYFGHLEASLGALPDGPLLDRASREAYHLAFFTSALEVLGRSGLERGESSPTRRLVAELDAAATPRAAELGRLLAALAEARSGRPVSETLAEELDGLATLGAPAKARVVEELRKVTNGGDPYLASVVQRLVRHLDARPKDRLRLGDLARGGLQNLRLAERTVRAGLTERTSPAHAVWLAGLTGDWGRLERLARAPHLPPALRARAVESLVEQRQLSPEAGVERLRALLAPTGNDWPLRQRLVERLEAAARHTEARAVISEWLGRRLLAPELDRVTARMALSRQFLLEGDAERAWSAIAPAVESWQFAPVRLAASILAARKKAGAAEEMARKLAKRYPGPRSDAVLAEVYWALGRDADAATVLASGHGTRYFDWPAVGEGFAAAVASRSDGDALHALEALSATGVDALSLSSLARAVATRGRPRLAFDILSRLRQPGLGELDLSVEAYCQLKAASDEKTARAWLETAVPSERRASLASVAMGARAYELLFTLVPAPAGKAPEDDAVWLTRAAAALELKALPEEHRGALAKRFERVQGSSLHVLGRHLLGLADEGTVLRQVGQDPKRACEVAFYLGKKAEAERRLEDASSWYRAAVDTRQERSPEFRWAVERLDSWAKHGKSLTRLSAQL